MRVKNTEPVCKESICSAHGVVPTSPCGIDVHDVASHRDDKLFEILSTCLAFKRYELSVDEPLSELNRAQTPDQIKSRLGKGQSEGCEP